MHGLANTKESLLPILDEELRLGKHKRITDFASGDGGPMIKITEELRKSGHDISLTLSDLYPNQERIDKLPPFVDYISNSVDASNPGNIEPGLRTMICSFHHLRPEMAQSVLQGFQDRLEHCVIYELSDNSSPKALWWTAIPVNIFSCLFISPLSKPFTFTQFVFTYLIPILPICFAWDGAVSNARTYTVSDLDELITPISQADYVWEKRTLHGKMKKLVLIGKPILNE